MRTIIGAIVAIVISMLVGIIVVSTLLTSINTTDWSPQAQQTWTQLQNNIWIVFGLLVILPLIVAAGAMLRIFGGEGGEV